MIQGPSRVQRILVFLLCFSLLPVHVSPPVFSAPLGPVCANADRQFVDPEQAATTTADEEDQSSPSALAAFPTFPDSVEQTNDLFLSLQQAATSLIHITDTGFNPPTSAGFGPTDVTWINDTATTHTLRSGEPGQTGPAKIFLPLIQRGSRSAVEAAAVYLPYLYQQASSADFSATLAPGQSFTYRFTAPEIYKFHLASAPTIQGELTLSGVALLRASPANGEGEVAVTRETVLEFSGALDPASVTPAAFTVRAGSATLAYRLNLSADKRRVTLFYKEVLPGSTRVRVSVDGSLIKDAQGNNVDPDGDGAAGGNTVLEFDTLSLTVIPGTEVCGRVFASELAVNASNVSVNTPLKDVTVSVDGLELQTKTDVNGNFGLNPAPAGRFFVHVDGHSATNNIPAGQFYPMVGKAWQSIPGQTTNVGDIYLPLVPPNTLQPVSAAQDTQITFADAVLQAHPDLNGVSILVPADSLFSDDGARGGKVGIAPVPPDRLPGKLPEGLNFPVVITVQTDGAGNFDTPAPVCFPNLPDPNTGATLQPGAKDALYSFNHDTGAWEAVGSMTVTADGRLVCSDPGVGIRAPGWHGNGPPPKGPPPPPPPCVNGKKPNPALLKCAKRALEDLAICTGGVVAGGLVCIVLSLGGCTPITGVAVAACAVKGAVDVSRCQEDNPACINALAVQQTQNALQRLPIDTIQAIQDTTTDQILAIQRQIQDLIYPYVIQGQSVPGSVQTQVDALNAQANALAGGNAEEYLRNYISQQDQLLIQRDDPGNAPPYPILYAAAVRRPGGAFYLRGKTAPEGQYTLFVPRDGSLLYVNFYDPQTNSYGIVFPHVTPNAPYLLPSVYLNSVDSSFADFDKDNLVDVVELVYGTDPAKPDTDGDGIYDGTEVAQGTDPLGGFIAQTGIIGSADTPGTAVDICVQNDMAVVADADAGVAIFNVFDSQNPKLIAQVDTPGNAQRVACVDGRVAVADGDSGLAIMDISNAATARIVHQLNLNGEVTAVTNAGNVAYAATAAGRVVAVDITTGAVLSEVTLPEGVQDLSLQAEYLYALTTQKLYALALQNNSLTLAGSADSPGQVGAGGRLWRLFVGGGLAYATHTQGYNTFDLTLPGQPVLLKAGQTQQFGWKQIVTNGAGVGIAAVGPNSTNDSQHNISLYDVRDPQQTDAFITQFDTPGLAAAVTIDKGRAYVADSQAGMQVINYLAYDNQKAPPTITLATNFAPGKAEEGALLRITADTTDDVQVRNVEFYIDGKVAANDGNFPFEYRFITPRIADQPSFKLRARAVDTGGNETWTDEQTITLVTDATPPRIVSTTPTHRAIVGADTLTRIAVTFNETMATNTFTADNFKLFAAGADRIPGTADDSAVNGGLVIVENATTIALQFATLLSPDHYQALLTTAITDMSGNPLAQTFAWTFQLVPTIQIGSVVNGEISVPYEHDIYYFTATPGQQVFFDLQNQTGITYVNWQVADATGATVFKSCLGCSEPGTKTLTQGGTYVLTVGNQNEDSTGAYQFQLWNVPAPQTFNINIGDTVSNGVPANGAGNIESPGVQDIYHFTATPGQQVFFDLQNQTGITYVNWRLTDETDAVIFEGCLGCSQVGVKTLTQGGAYTLTFGNDRYDEDGTYQFQLWNVPAPQTFNINIGDTVSNGVPANGAGNIESPGVQDIYHFTATAGQQVEFHLLNQTGITYVNWRLTDATGTVIFERCLGCSQVGVKTLTQGGAYTLTFGNDRYDGIGTYQFQLIAR